MKGRRDFIREAALGAGLVSPVAAFLAGEVTVLAKSEETDVSILNAALAIEERSGFTARPDKWW